MFSLFFVPYCSLDQVQLVWSIPNFKTASPTLAFNVMLTCGGTICSRTGAGRLTVQGKSLDQPCVLSTHSFIQQGWSFLGWFHINSSFLGTNGWKEPWAVFTYMYLHRNNISCPAVLHKYRIDILYRCLTVCEIKTVQLKLTCNTSEGKFKSCMPCNGALL